MYIYLIKNNKEDHKRFGWQYIGQRTIDIDLKPEEDKYMGSSKLLSNDIKELGLEYFSKEILEPICINKKHLNDKEIYWIEKYNTYLGIGYNLTQGGGGFSGNHSDESKNKISAGGIGRKRSKETNDKTVVTRKKNNITWLSIETKRKMSINSAKNMLGKFGKDNPNSKPILQINKYTNKVIKIWDCLSDVTRELGISTSQISRVCIGDPKKDSKGYYYIPKTAHGYKWRYA